MLIIAQPSEPNAILSKITIETLFSPIDKTIEGKYEEKAWNAGERDININFWLKWFITQSLVQSLVWEEEITRMTLNGLIILTFINLLNH